MTAAEAISKTAIAVSLLATGCPKSTPAIAPTPPISIEPDERPAMELHAMPAPMVTELGPLDPTDGDPVTPTFGWPAGAEAKTTHAVVALQFNGDVMSSRTITQAEWTESFVASKDGHRYGRRDAVGSTAIEPPPPAAEAIQAIMTALALASVETVVDEQGAWTAVDGVDGLRSEVAAKVVMLIDGLPGPLQEALRATLEDGLAQETLERDSRRLWEALVSDWVGQTYPIGDEVEADGAVVVARGWVPCTDEPDAPRECVVFERTVKAPPEQVEQARARVQSAVMASWPPGAPIPTLGESEMFTAETLVTRPDTLLPVAYTKRKASSHAFHVGERVVPWGRDLRTTTTWTWTLP